MKISGLRSLRQLYRQTFERLVAQNRIEEAAFVLAELLKSNLEAVEFLEKHRKFRLAAELAESRNLAKDIIVRQWFLAGEKRRAIQFAVLHNCFEYVVTKLEQQKTSASRRITRNLGGKPSGKRQFSSGDQHDLEARKQTRNRRQMD